MNIEIGQKEPYRGLAQILRDKNSISQLTRDALREEITRIHTKNDVPEMIELVCAYIEWTSRQNPNISTPEITKDAYRKFDIICAAADLLKLKLIHGPKIATEEEFEHLTLKTYNRAILTHRYMKGDIQTFYRDAVKYHPELPSSNIEVNTKFSKKTTLEDTMTHTLAGFRKESFNHQLAYHNTQPQYFNRN